MAPLRSASNRIAVLPMPGTCSAGVTRCAVWVRISPRIVDSVKRLEPILRTGSAPAAGSAGSRVPTTRRGRRPPATRRRTFSGLGPAPKAQHAQLADDAPAEHQHADHED